MLRLLHEGDLLHCIHQKVNGKGPPEEVLSHLHFTGNQTVKLF